MGVPGVTFERVDLNRPRVARLRTDICGFLGYAERGPLDRPLKLESWRQFLDAYGPPLGYAHTGHSIRLFFDNGGAACYMMRVADPVAAAPATLDLGGAATLTAAFSAIGRPRTEGTGPTSVPSTATESPGTWGNRLTVTVSQGGLGMTRTLPNQPADGATSVVETVAGLAPGSWVRLADVKGVYARILTLDLALREITWEVPIAGLGLDLSRPVQLETVEFTLTVALDGEEVARHRNLSLDPEHPRRIDQVLAAESAHLSASIDVDAGFLHDPGRWPQPGQPQRLTGGRDGLATVDKADHLAALALFEAVDEISVLAAPDLVLRATPETLELAAPPKAMPCKLPEAPPAGRLIGLVTEAGTGAPLAGVRVTSRDVETRAALTAADGTFTLAGLPLGQAALRLAKAGYTALEGSGQAFTVPPAVPQKFEMAPTTLPLALVEDEIVEVQTAMILQGERGFYRVALLDPPEERLGIEDIQDWRARFDTSFAALYWPWLIISPPGAPSRSLPPSGTVAGLIARMDLLEGPQRAVANRPFRNVDAPSRPVDDALHGLFNEQGINVIRATPGRGIAPQGARTVSSDSALRYLGVRRLLLMIAEAIEEGHQWAVFEPNGPELRAALTHSLTQFLAGLWRRGAFAGTSPDEAFGVKCDEENNPPEVIDAGQVVAEIAVAPVRPYEFIRLRLGRTDRLTVEE
jgi:hypothetical protein